MHTIEKHFFSEFQLANFVFRCSMVVEADKKKTPTAADYMQG